jgi:hypothetical protein
MPHIAVCHYLHTRRKVAGESSGSWPKEFLGWGKNGEARGPLLAEKSSA